MPRGYNGIMAKDTVQEIKDRLPIAEVIAPYVKLTRAGRSLKGICPFHKEKTPSFHVSPERGTYHCFGCGEGGDAFSFIEKIEGLDFKEALAVLAEKAGVEIVSSGYARADTSRAERLREIMARAAQWYARQFPGSPAQTYAKARGLTDETAALWNLGYAPDSWRALLEAFTTEGCTVEELVAAGLVKEADGKPGTFYDRFRNRLLFPISDAAGKVVAYTGRILESSTEGRQEAKYLNSPETDLYRKSEILFGLNLAKEAIRLRKFTLLVEGQMDAVVARQAGFENVVALSGTALSEKHLTLLKRYSDNLMLALDADAAGMSATARSAELALRAGLRVKAVRLPAGKDPADLAGEDPQEFARRIASAKPAVEFFLAVLAEREADPHRLLRETERVVLPLLAALASPMEREHFLGVTARTLGLSSEAVRESLTRLPRAGTPTPSLTPSRAAPVRAEPRLPRAAREEQLIAVIRAYPGTGLAEHVAAEYSRITGAHHPPAHPLPESALFFAEQALGENPPADAANELLRAFEEAVIREAHEAAVTRLRKAETADDAAAISAAQEECRDLSARLALLAR